MGIARVRQIYYLMPKETVHKLLEGEQYHIVRVSRTPYSLNYENLLAITSLQPSYIDWVTAVSGIPLHPDYVAKRGTMSSSTISSFEKFRRMLQEAKYIRSLCKDQNGEWLDSENAMLKISDHISYYCRGNLDNANYMAQILQQTLTSDTAQLYDVLLVLTGALKLCMQIFHIQGPVGSGKSITIRAFCVFYSLLFRSGNILIVSTQNAPCNKFCEDMFETSQHSNMHFTRVAARGEVDKLRSEKVKFIECVTGTSEHHERHLFNYSKTNVIITTVGMTAKSHNVKGTVELVIPCESFDVVFQDEKQNESGENLMLNPSFLKPFESCSTIR